MKSPLLKTAIANNFEFGIDYIRVDSATDADNIMTRFGKALMETAELLGKPYIIRWQDNEFSIPPHTLKFFEENMTTRQKPLIIANEVITRVCHQLKGLTKLVLYALE